MLADHLFGVAEQFGDIPNRDAGLLLISLL